MERPRSLTPQEVQELMSVLRIVSGEDLRPLYTIPPEARFGAHFFYNKACSYCHTVDGQGGKSTEIKGPDLTLRLLRSKQWHMDHIRDATSVVPESKMPPFLHYEPHEYAALAEYILYLHTP
jgi:mono/diheme cytochrome c family protein